jgi:hypothetical protein
LLIGLLVVLSWQCVDPPAEPVMPTWDVDFSLPLANRIYTLEEIIEKNPNVFYPDESGTIVYSFSDTVQNEPLGERIRLKPGPTDFSFEVGLFSLETDDVRSTVPMSSHLPYPGGYTGTSTGVDPVQIGGALPAIDEIEYMVFESGTVVLELVNNSGVPVRFPDGFHLHNVDDGVTVGRFTYPGIIQPNESIVSTLTLENTRVYQSLTYAFVFSSPPEDEVTIPPDPALDLTLRFEELEVIEASARIPGQIFPGSFDGSFIIDDSTFIRHASFEQGGLELRVVNDIDVDIPVTLTLNEFFRVSNPSQQFRYTTHLSRQSDQSVYIDLREWIIDTGTSEATNTFSYNLTLGEIAETDDYRTVRASDVVGGKIRPLEPPHQELVVDRMEGRMAPTPFDVSELIELDLGEVPDFLEGDFTYGNVKLELGLLLNGGFDVDIDVHLVGINRYGKQDSLEIPTDRQRLSAGAWNTIVFDSENSRINEFMRSFAPNFPEEFLVVGTAVVNPDFADGFVDQRDYFNTSVDLTIPFNFGIRDGIVRDTLAIEDGDDDIDREVFDYFNYGTMYFESVNAIPLGMELRLCLLDERGAVLREFPLEHHPAIGILAAPVDESGLVSLPADRDIRFLELTSEDIVLIRQADQTELILHINTTDGSEKVIFSVDNYLHLKIFATFNVHADFN